MAILTIDLSEEAASYFAALPSEAQTQIAQQINAFATASINQRKADAEGTNGIDAEDAAWWSTLTPQQKEAERTSLERGLMDIDAGRTHPAEAVYERIRAKYAQREISTPHDAL